MNILATFRRFKLNLGVIIASILQRNNNYMTSSFLNLQWHSPPGPAPPLLTPII